MPKHQNSSNRLAEVVFEESLLWGDDVGNAYHASAEKAIEGHWQSLVVPATVNISIDLTRCIDFACGRGRNTIKLLETGASHVTMVDVNIDNVEFCKNRMQGNARTSFVNNNGYDLRSLMSDNYTFFFTLDAMVHFDIEICFAYVSEIARVLAPGGTALIHHSNYTKNVGGDFRTSPHWRNYMSAEIFKHIAMRNGFTILRQNIIPWGDLQDSDCISVMRKGL